MITQTALKRYFCRINTPSPFQINWFSSKTVKDNSTRSLFHMNSTSSINNDCTPANRDACSENTVVIKNGDSENLPSPTNMEDKQRADTSLTLKPLIDNDNPKLKKRKVAIVFGYLGGAYFGLQRQNGPLLEKDIIEQKSRPQLVNTIEDEIVKALLAAGAIRYEHALSMQKMRFQRAARTDKGVSAIANFISLKLFMVEDLKNKINKLIPNDIKIFDIIQVCQGFDCKKACDYRTYSYLLPTYCLMDVVSRGGVITVDSHFDPESNDDDRLSFEKAKAVLKFYEGSHNFHNFTTRRRFTDPSCVRHIISTEISKPFYITAPSFKTADKSEDKVEMEKRQYCRITVTGQSFMLNQIRKMVAVMTFVSRGLLNLDWIKYQAYQSERLSILKAPAEGLYLNQVFYKTYNRRYGNDGIHSNLSLSNIQNDLHDFEHNTLIPSIIRKCYCPGLFDNKNIFIDWLAYAIACPVIHCYTDDNCNNKWTFGLGYAQSMARLKRDVDDTNSSPGSELEVKRRALLYS
ncbi:hypothetical protein GJ496_004161 [Pomphorhynchus laevis]|nr:hypothetical protein GJ496_004161 [Pomphorhynchus laevis]